MNNLTFVDILRLIYTAICLTNKTELKKTHEASEYCAVIPSGTYSIVCECVCMATSMINQSVRPKKNCVM